MKEVGQLWTFNILSHTCPQGCSMGCLLCTYWGKLKSKSSLLPHNKIYITVYPKKYAHGFCFAVLCCGYTLTDFPISIRLTSLALWQSDDCPSASKATLMNMDKYFIWIHYERLHNHKKQSTTKACAYFLGYTVHQLLQISEQGKEKIGLVVTACTVISTLVIVSPIQWPLAQLCFISI